MAIGALAGAGTNICGHTVAIGSGAGLSNSASGGVLLVILQEHQTSVIIRL